MTLVITLSITRFLKTPTQVSVEIRIVATTDSIILTKSVKSRVTSVKVKSSDSYIKISLIINIIDIIL